VRQFHTEEEPERSFVPSTQLHGGISVSLPGLPFSRGEQMVESSFISTKRHLTLLLRDVLDATLVPLGSVLKMSELSVMRSVNFVHHEV
jgi:hypothetical protein